MANIHRFPIESVLFPKSMYPSLTTIIVFIDLIRAHSTVLRSKLVWIH